MIKSKLFVILKSLSQPELNRFGKFLNSPFFNESSVLIKLFKEYRKYYPDFEDLDIRKIFKDAFPSKDFNEALLRNYNSDLLKLGEDFLIQVNLNREATLKPLLLNELNHRKLYSLFESSYKNAFEELGRSPYRDSDYFRSRYKLLTEKYQYSFRKRNTSELDIDELEKSFVNYCINDLLVQCATRENNRPILDLKNEHLLKGEVLKIVEKNNDIFQHSVLANYYSLRMLLDNSEKYYAVLKNHIDKYGHEMEPLNHYNTYIKMISFNVRNKDGFERMRENFALTKKIIEKNLAVRNGIIPHAVYTDQVKDGLELQEFKWVYDFIENYKKWLSDDIRENVYNYCIGRYYYYTGNSKKALEHLSKVPKNNYILPLAIRNLIARVQWEESDAGLIAANIAAYRQYISENKKLTKRDISRHSLFINTYSKIFKCKFDGKEFNTSKAKQEVLNGDLPSKEWLLEKISELEASF